jgi:hypothetical protein
VLEDNDDDEEELLGLEEDDDRGDEEEEEVTDVERGEEVGADVDEEEEVGVGATEKTHGPATFWVSPWTAATWTDRVLSVESTDSMVPYKVTPEFGEATATVSPM